MVSGLLFASLSRGCCGTGEPDSGELGEIRQQRCIETAHMQTWGVTYLENHNGRFGAAGG